MSLADDATQLQVSLLCREDESMADVFPVVVRGFGKASAAYARGRPDYPEELLSWFRQKLEIGPGKTVIDLGAGTGKMTRLLIRTGANIIAIEPVDAMRAELAAGMPGIRALAGSAQSTTLSDSSADAVVCAQAFHWFANERALKEIHRVLKPGGYLGLIWNVRDASADWVAAITKIIAPYEGDSPRYSSGDWRRALADGSFSELEETCLAYEHIGPAAQVILDRCLSVSFIAALPDHEKAPVVDRLNQLIAAHPAIRGREVIAFPYRTHAYRFARK
jgi:ubiquinone/menaquinone biosynthesis C-methylase UbiE